MNSNESIYAALENADTTARVAMYAGLGNWALGQLIYNCQRYVRDLAATHDLDPTLGADAIVMAEEAMAEDGREPPVGLERVETVGEKMKRFGALYSICLDRAIELGGDEYNRPQAISDRVDWLASQTSVAFEKAKTLKARGDLTAALRVASQANQDAKFWKENKQAIIDEAAFHAGSINTSDDAYELDDLFGSAVERINAVAGMYKAVLSRCNNRKASRFFEASGPLGDQLRSEVGIFEAELGAIRLLDAAIQRANSAELMEAINRGVNIRLLDDVEKQMAQQLNAKLERQLAALGV